MSLEKSIFRLALYIFKLKMHIFRLNLYIFSLKMNFSRHIADFWSVSGEVFRPPWQQMSGAGAVAGGSVRVAQGTKKGRLLIGNGL